MSHTQFLPATPVVVREGWPASSPPSQTGIFADRFRGTATVDVYVEAAAVTTVLVLFGQVIEVREQTSLSQRIGA